MRYLLATLATTPLTSRAFILAMSIEHLSAKGDHIATYDRLCGIAGMSKRAMQYAVAELEEQGVLSGTTGWSVLRRERTPSGSGATDGRSTPYAWWVTHPEDAKQVRPSIEDFERTVTGILLDHDHSLFQRHLRIVGAACADRRGIVSADALRAVAQHTGISMRTVAKHMPVGTVIFPGAEPVQIQPALPAAAAPVETKAVEPGMLRYALEALGENDWAHEGLMKMLAFDKGMGDAVIRQVIHDEQKGRLPVGFEAEKRYLLEPRIAIKRIIAYFRQEHIDEGFHKQDAAETVTRAIGIMMDKEDLGQVRTYGACFQGVVDKTAPYVAGSTALGQREAGYRAQLSARLATEDNWTLAQLQAFNRLDSDTRLDLEREEKTAWFEHGAPITLDRLEWVLTSSAT